MSGDRYGVFAVGNHLIGVPAAQIHEIFQLGEVRVPPNCPPEQRGLAVLRGNVFPALDLRVCLGHVSAREESEALAALLGEREEDHRRWVAELEASVRERRPFRLATDPRKCKFGQWYYAFKSDDAVLRSELAKFEEPHARIHALAIEVGKLVEAGQLDRALERIEQTRRGLLATLVEQFERTRAALHDARKEVGVTVELNGRRSVLIVDRAEAVADLEPIAAEDDPLAAGTLPVDLVRRLARWRGSPAPVLLLDVERVGNLAG
ncbi:MAG: chemotaxis protein CheW [Anaeromyxobacteraceae bacterium]